MCSKNKYDCIIIGAGIGGLLLSNMLASKQMNVLLLEKNSFVGGSFSKLKCQDFKLDLAVSYFLGFEKNGWLLKRFHQMSLCDILFKKIPTPDRYIFPDFEFDLVSDIQEMQSKLANLYPNESQSIFEYFAALQNIYLAMTELQSSNFTKVPTTLSNYLNIKYIDYLNDHFKEPSLKAILSARIFGSQVDFVTMAAYLGKLIIDGIYQEMSHDNLSHILLTGLEKKGVEVALNQEVTSISINNNKATKVWCENTLYEANYVVSACDMINSFCSIIKPELSITLQNRLIGNAVSLSSLSLFLVLKDLPMSIKENRVARVYLFENYDIGDMYSRKEHNEFDYMSVIKVNIPHIMDSHFVEKERYNMRVEIDISLNSIKSNVNWDEIKENIINILICKLKIHKEDIITSLLLSPKDFRKLIGTSQGAASGWSPNTRTPETPYIEKLVAKNFFQIGCWDRFGSGIFPIFLSAQRVERAILKSL